MNDNPYQSPTAPPESPTSGADVPLDESPIVARYVWTADELIRGYEAFQLLQWRRGYRLALVILTGGLAGVSWLVSGFSHSFFVISALFVLLYLAFFNRTLAKWRIRRQFARRPDAHAEFEWRFCPGVVYRSTYSSRSEQLWTTFAKMVESPEGVLLFTDPMIFHWIPRHAFESDLEYDRFLQLAESRITSWRRVK